MGTNGLRKAELLKKKKQKKKQTAFPSKDFEFCDLDMTSTSKSDIVEESDHSKRKDISPVQSDIIKKTKTYKDKN